jgi:hypothetical protein
VTIRTNDARLAVTPTGDIELPVTDFRLEVTYPGLCHCFRLQKSLCMFRKYFEDEPNGATPEAGVSWLETVLLPKLSRFDANFEQTFM